MLATRNDDTSGEEIMEIEEKNLKSVWSVLFMPGIRQYLAKETHLEIREEPLQATSQEPQLLISKICSCTCPSSNPA